MLFACFDLHQFVSGYKVSLARGICTDMISTLDWMPVHLHSVQPFKSNTTSSSTALVLPNRLSTDIFIASSSAYNDLLAICRSSPFFSLGRHKRPMSSVDNSRLQSIANDIATGFTTLFERLNAQVEVENDLKQKLAQAARKVSCLHYLL